MQILCSSRMACVGLVASVYIIMVSCHRPIEPADRGGRTSNGTSTDAPKTNPIFVDEFEFDDVHQFDGTRLFLVPFLPGRGIPIVHRRPYLVPTYEDGFWSNSERPEEPFPADVPFDLAVWADGTVIWAGSESSLLAESGRQAPPSLRTYYRAKLRADEVHEHLARIDLSFFKGNERAPSLETLPSATGIAHARTALYIRCDLEAMEALGRYRFRGERGSGYYPTDEYSFEEFCQAAPDDYAEYLKNYRQLRMDLERLVPAVGEQVDPVDTVLWVFTNKPAQIALD